MPNLNENVPLVAKLLAKTKEGKIDWKGTYDQSVFICVLDGQYTFELDKGKTAAGLGFQKLIMKTGDEEVLTVRARSPTQSSPRQEDEMFELLGELYDSARRIALNIDQKLNAVSNILDNL
jgi:hypothetical protein